MIARRLGYMLFVAVALGTATTYAQQAAATINLERTSGGLSAARGGQATSLFSAFQYGFQCTVTVWDEGYFYGWPLIYLYANVELSVDGIQADYAYNEGWVLISATTSAWFDATQYDKFVSCSADTTAGPLSGWAIAPGIPDGETTESNGWDGGGYGDSVHRWVQTLTPSDGNYGGRIITEQDGGGGNDTCHFSGSQIDRVDRVTGGTWLVVGNRWGVDRVGWRPVAVEYYRNQGAAPCDFTLNQIMVINVGSDQVEYTANQLAAGITEISVWSRRAGQEAERIWP